MIPIVSEGVSSPPLSAAALQREVVEEFAFFETWTEKYQYLIDQGKDLPPFPAQHRVDRNLLSGCVSQVWIVVDFEDGGDRVLHFQADSDSAIVRGLIALVMRVYNHRTARKILETPPDFLKDIGLDKYLSPSRSNGLASMVAYLFKTARAAI